MAEWQKRFWSTTASGYAGVVVRMLLGLVLFRLMFQEFSGAEFGFWALLWSLFGYGILLDFGFGFTAQKAVAEKTATGDLSGLSRLLSTILWTFIAMAVALLLVFLLIREPFLVRMGVDGADREAFGQAYVVFFIGLAFMFPLGLFPEILRGLQRIDIANWLGTLSTVLNFVFLYWGLKAEWSMAWLMLVSVVTSILPNLVAAVVAIRRLPGVSFAPRFFEWRSVRSQMGFSVAAYLITFSNMLMAKSDQLVISLTLGVALVAIYQAGYKMGEMLGLFSTQLQQVLSPAAAAMHATGDREGLRNLLLGSSRLTFFLVTPCYLLSAVYLDPLIRLLTGMEVVARETWWVGQALLFAVYSSQLTSGCSKRVLMMCGEEKKLLAISLVDAIANVVLSVILAYRFGVLGVALGTMIPTALVGWLWVVPLTIRKLGISVGSYLGHHWRGTLLPLAVFGAILGGLSLLAPAGPSTGMVGLGWRGLLCMIPFLYLGKRVIADITKPISP
ncbi:MAG: oligosaccharide flippase family protein [Akkermansiaceae bacterium]|jgi:O-antigen/teichoic acid export membrane protein|nr:oligosaccharide flippase family protein [Akkermansiaceae bacterium]